MRIGVLGTGMVGSAIGSALVRAGHQVRMGSRTKDNAKAQAWVTSAGEGASQGTFADAAAYGEVVFNCTAGANSLAAIEAAGAGNLRDKILIDVANPLDFSKGMPPTLTVHNTDSLGEQIQRALPETKVVKVLNTVNCRVSVNPSRVPGEHNLFLCGNDATARARVANWMSEWFGWPAGSCIDLGDITGARGTEMLLPLWVRLYSTFGTPDLNFRVIVAERSVQ
jgi:predicted dinucleotide-binding enzyme